MLDLKASRRHSRFQFISRKGQTLVEYALILAIISVVAISTMLGLGGQTRGIYSNVNVQLNDAQNGGETAPTRH